MAYMAEKVRRQTHPLRTFTLDGGAKIDGASIVTPDIEASNGVIHVIDKVIMPPAN